MQWKNVQKVKAILVLELDHLIQTNFKPNRKELGRIY